MSIKHALRVVPKTLVMCLVGMAVFMEPVLAVPPGPPQPVSRALAPAEITALAAQLNADINAAPAPVQIYAVIARFIEVNIASRGVGSAGAITSVVIAGATLPGTRIRDVDLGDGLAHAAISFGVRSDVAKNIAATVGHEASGPVRNYFVAITKALTGLTIFADIVNDGAPAVGDISNGVPNGLGVTLTPNLPGVASCLNPSCTQL